MITSAQFEKMTEELASLEYQYDWDNSGWNIKDHDEIGKVLTCLDVTSEIVDEARELGCDTILSHHPVMFRAVKKIFADDPVTGVVLKAAKLGINIYCSHTACDCAPMGLNLKLAKKIGIEEPRIFISEGEGYGLGFIGELEEAASPDEFAKKVKEALGCERLRYTPTDEKISRAAAIGGSAGEFFKEAKAQGAQALIVGEAKYNDFLDAKSMGVMLVEAGHFETEVCFADMMTDYLQKKINEVKYSLTVISSKKMIPPYKAI